MRESEWFKAPITVRMAPWWTWNVGTNTQSVTMGHRLDCGHEVKAMSRTSNEQLRRNFDRVVSRHRCSDA